MKYFNFVLFVISLFVLNSYRFPPHQFNIIGLVSFLIPVILAINFLLLIYWLRKLSFQAALPIIALLFGIKFLVSTVAINLGDKEVTADSFTVLSYNVRVFNFGWGDSSRASSRQMLDWIVDNESDIKCFQEFYTKEGEGLLNTVEEISDNGKYEHHLAFAQNKNHKRNGEKLGIAIFSKFPIVNHGEIDFGAEFSINKGAFADIKIGNDTIRVISVHLASMSIDQRDLLKDELEEAKKNYLFIARRVNTGMQARSRQILEVERIILESPHKVILCGDFNEIPYGYVYFKVKEHLISTFEEAAKGFGFTYNGFLFFLRIDHLFHDPAIEAIDYTTFKSAKQSDHFPIQGTFSLKK